ncbi:MAG: putative hemolysin [Nonlabens sp.]
MPRSIERAELHRELDGWHVGAVLGEATLHEQVSMLAFWTREGRFVGIGWQLALVAVLIGINAVFAGSELALLSLREGQLERLEREGSTGRAVALLARDPNRFLATLQVGITLAGFLASATAAVTLAEPLVRPFGALGAGARPTAVVLVTAVLTFLTLVFGELAPKRLALERPEAWARVVARPLSGVAQLARPVVWLLGRATDLVVRLCGGDPAGGRQRVTDDEIRDMVRTAGFYSHDERRIITGALEATGRVLRQVMRPRTTVLALPAGLSSADGLRRLVEASHSRAPVFVDTLDDADRVISLRDLVGASGTVGEHARPAPVLPESVALVEALRQLQLARQSMALVVSEHGGVEGIVTVEDLVEELVGEIHDEFDRDVREAVHHDDGSVEVVGHFPVHDLVDLGVELPRGDYVTVAGLIQDRLQRLAVTGDQIEVAGWSLHVDAMRDRAVQRVTLAPRVPRQSGRVDVS